MSRSPGEFPARAFCRAVAGFYGCSLLLPAASLLVVLPLLQAVVRRLSRGRAQLDPWWPLVSFFVVAGTLPRFAEWLETRFSPAPDRR